MRHSQEKWPIVCQEPTRLQGEARHSQEKWPIVCQDPTRLQGEEVMIGMGFYQS